MRTLSHRLAGCWLALLLLTATPASAAEDMRLAQAAKRGDAEGVRTLLKQQVNVNTPLPDGATALHWAAQWDDVDTANLLIIAHANPNATDVYGVTPLSLACTNGSAATLQPPSCCSSTEPG